MEKKEILEKSQKKKALVGEMEKAKINKSNWIAIVGSCAVAVALMIIEGALGNFSALYAIGTICFTWGTIFYTCQFFVAKRPWQVLIGSILEGLGALIMLTFFILVNCGVV